MASGSLWEAGGATSDGQKRKQRLLTIWTRNFTKDEQIQWRLSHKMSPTLKLSSLQFENLQSCTTQHECDFYARLRKFAVLKRNMFGLKQRIKSVAAVFLVNMFLHDI